jgi:hypothetical protein
MTFPLSSRKSQLEFWLTSARPILKFCSLQGPNYCSHALWFGFDLDPFKSLLASFILSVGILEWALWVNVNGGLMQFRRGPIDFPPLFQILSAGQEFSFNRNPNPAHFYLFGPDTSPDNYWTYVMLPSFRLCTEGAPLTVSQNPFHISFLLHRTTCYVCTYL